MFRDELHLISINPWADHWLMRPVYRGDIALHGNVVPTIAELAMLPSQHAAKEAGSWLYGQPAAHVRDALRAAMIAHPDAASSEIQGIIWQL